MKYFQSINPTRELLAETQQRLPADKRVIQEAFTTDHRRPVLVNIGGLTANTFYYLDDIASHAFSDALIELAAGHSHGKLTVSYPFNGEFRAQQHRLQHIASRLDSIRVLTVDAIAKPAVLASGVEVRDIARTPLARFRIAMKQDVHPMLFICRDTRQSPISDGPRSIGFFTFDPDIIEEIADDIAQILHGLSTHLTAFERLEVLHRTTQRVSRELESYSRRMELAIERARRRPDLLTPDRLDRILGQCAAKMRELEEIPRRAMRAIERSKR